MDWSYPHSLTNLPVAFFNIISTPYNGKGKPCLEISQVSQKKMPHKQSTDSISKTQPRLCKHQQITEADNHLRKYQTQTVAT